MNTNGMQNPDELSSDFFAGARRLFPDIYNTIMPYIDEAINNLGGNHNFSDEDINMLTDNIIAESRIMMSPPDRHNRETIHDIVKMLLIIELENMDNMYEEATPAVTPFFPWWLIPFFIDGRGFDGNYRRRRRRPRDRDRDRGMRRY